jgi:hydroxymethylpyrimidine/phosphomethylpyrimidine kinase
MQSTPNSASPPIVLTIAASDPSGGTGIQADLMTIASFGCHPLSVVTVLTVQDSAGIEDFMRLEPDWVEDQVRAILEDMPVNVFKTGLLGSVENIAVVAEILADYPDIPLILDPALAPGRGDELCDEDMVAAIRELLLPQTTIVTPNSWEARRLCQENEEEDETASHDIAPLDECVKQLLGYGCEYVLLSGTHENTPKVVNRLYHRNGCLRSDTWERLPGTHHGAGCTLSSALAACLAQGLSVEEAVHQAQDYTWQSLSNGFRPGMGRILPNRFFWARQPGSHDGDSI